MADAVTSTLVQDGVRLAVFRLTNISDGTGEDAVTKVDVSTLDPAPTHLAIEEIWSSVAGMEVRLFFDADVDDHAWTVAAGNDHFDFRKNGPIIDPRSTGSTGNVKLSTVNASPGDSYSILIQFQKRFG